LLTGRGNSAAPLRIPMLPAWWPAALWSDATTMGRLGSTHACLALQHANVDSIRHSDAGDGAMPSFGPLESGLTDRLNTHRIVHSGGPLGRPGTHRPPLRKLRSLATRGRRRKPQRSEG
jgi:hypothetical protein